MQHTLIPLRDRKRLHREYTIRLLTASVAALTLATAFGAAALFPSYLRAFMYSQSAENQISALRANKVDKNLDDIKSELLKDQDILNALSQWQANQRISTIIKSIVSVRGKSRISSMVVSHIDDKKTSVAIMGISPNRDELLTLRARLETLVPDTKIEIPIDQLAKNINPEFKLSFTINTP